MAFTLKPADLEKATRAADVQKKMKADLKSSVGKKNVKFIAAKNCTIGGKTVHLFIVTDNPNPFEAILKTKQPRAYRAKGICDIEKDKATGATKVAIKSSSGQMAADAVGRLIPLAVTGDKSFMVTFPAAEKAKLLAEIQNKRALHATPKVESGVPDWAQEAYRKDAKQTLIASMTPDGKIGSVYFGQEGRIRTTHGSGPQKSKHAGQTTLQFNINEKQAIAEFLKGNPTSRDRRDFNKWLSNKLVNVTVNNAPAWAKRVSGPDTAHDLRMGGISKDTKLFEIFRGINGRVEGWHPSRGTATKFETDKQTISVLEAAIRHIDGKGLKDAGERNKEFYNFVKSRLPKFAPMMRDPSTIKTK